MYTTVVDNSPKIRVSSGRHVADYAIDGSLMNPLEAFYASLAACAAISREVPPARMIRWISSVTGMT